MYEEKNLTSEAGEPTKWVGIDEKRDCVVGQERPWTTIRLTEVQAREVFEFLGKHLGIETVEAHKAKLAAQGRASR